MIKRLHGLFIDNPSKNDKLVIYGRSFTDAGIMQMIRLKIFELPLEQLAEDNFELMFTLEPVEKVK